MYTNDFSTQILMQPLDQLLGKLNNEYKPSLVSLKPEAYSNPENCFFNVQEKVKREDGKIFYGWKIHLSPILLEAERHAVWQSCNSEVVDITPDSKYSDKILFLKEDKGWTYTGEFIDNVRLNLTQNPLVDDYILLSETITELWQMGKRVSHNEMTLDSRILDVIHYLEQDKVLREKYIYDNHSIESACYCRRPVTYKECHGLNLKMVYYHLLNKARLKI